MDVTPPLQIRVQTPPTPRHGPLYDRYPNASRHSARLADKRRHRETNSSSDPGSPVKVKSGRGALISTPTSSRHSSRHSPTNLSPPQSYKASPKRISTRKVHIVSPDSPVDNTSGGSSKVLHQSTNTSYQPHSKQLTATTISTGMLPTPVKTPKKKKMAPNVNAPARTLFENQPIIGEEVEAAPKRSRKARKYNGFSLDSFSAEADGKQAPIQIFTDSKEKVPELDLTEENPFIDQAGFGQGSSSKRARGTSKRRKISAERKYDRNDKDVSEAVRKDEGMIYVFRGRKIYRRFNEDDEAEEGAESPIDVSDLGLLAQSSDPNQPDPTKMRSVRPLTRKSVKPTRLFQTEKQARDRAAKMEDEISTDIEDEDTLSSPTVKVETPLAQLKDEVMTPLSPGRTLRSERTIQTNFEDSEEEKPSEVIRKKGKKTSPFDSWKRVKRASGETPSASSMVKGKKRDLDEANEEHVPVVKRTRA